MHAYPSEPIWGFLWTRKSGLIFPGTSMPIGHFLPADPKLTQSFHVIDFSHKHKQTHHCYMYTTPPLLKEKLPRLPWPAVANPSVPMLDATHRAAPLTPSQTPLPTMPSATCRPQPPFPPS